jgi:hypothetical protein
VSLSGASNRAGSFGDKFHKVWCFRRIQYSGQFVSGQREHNFPITAKTALQILMIRTMMPL